MKEVVLDDNTQLDIEHDGDGRYKVVVWVSDTANFKGCTFEVKN